MKKDISFLDEFKLLIKSLSRKKEESITDLEDLKKKIIISFSFGIFLISVSTSATRVRIESIFLLNSCIPLINGSSFFGNVFFSSVNFEGVVGF